MNKLVIVFVLASLCIQSSAQSKEDVLSEIDSKVHVYDSLAKQIWSFAEVGYQEYKSSALLQKTLTDAGFQLETGVAGMPTAFTATYGSGKPVVCILGEFDALPGLSQEAMPEQKAIIHGAAGHGCGHNLFGVGSAAAAIAVANWLSQSKNTGTIRYYGTPAEEGGGGKIYFVKAGLFDDVDAVFHWHPGSGNSADAASSLANKSAKFRFYGTAAHASGAPQFGRSALDAVEAMNHMANMMREHIAPESRIHYVITEGGDAPNVVPAFAEVFYYCRHPDIEVLEKNFEWLVKAAEGAALGTETRMDYEVIHGLYNVKPNETLARIMHENLNYVGGYAYTEEELDFAIKIMATLPAPANLENVKMVMPFRISERGSGGSTDVGDVSWVVPTAGVRTATFVPGTTNHSWQAVATAGTSIGTKGMIVAAKTIALSAIELFISSEVIQQAKEELERRRGSNFEYRSLVGDREPPLDYRN